MKKYALIVAGGIGKRMLSEMPKQFLLIHGKPVLYYTINAFLTAFTDLEVILVLPEEHVDKGLEIIDAYFDKSRIKITNGGETRFHSVKKGLELVPADAMVFVHDGVRCLVKPALIQKCYNIAEQVGTAIPIIGCKDSVRVLKDDTNYSLNRNDVKLIQTPQTFLSNILKPAMNIEFKEKFTDEATVVEAFGIPITLVDGNEENIKITTKMDLILAELLMETA